MAFEGTPTTPVDFALDPTLEGEYNLRVRHPERSAVYRAQAIRSDDLRTRVAGFRTFRYAAGAACLLDFLPSPSATAVPAPLFVFVHGGFWRALDRSIFTFLAEPWLERGFHCALVGYDLVPTVTVRIIVSQVSQAVTWLRDEASSLHIDTDRVLISGHSAGGHLGACVLDGMRDGVRAIDDWHAAAFVGLSGVYDLEPLLRTNVNADIRLDSAEAIALSPLRRSSLRPTRHLLAVGAAETEGFKAQSSDFAAALRRDGNRVDNMLVAGRTHFDILDEFADPGSELFRRSYELMSA
ncbi:alpha/beta hydrolase [soil metagenome]